MHPNFPLSVIKLLPGARFASSPCPWSSLMLLLFMPTWNACCVYTRKKAQTASGSSHSHGTSSGWVKLSLILWKRRGSWTAPRPSIIAEQFVSCRSSCARFMLTTSPLPTCIYIRVCWCVHTFSSVTGDWQLIWPAWLSVHAGQISYPQLGLWSGAGCTHV